MQGWIEGFQESIDFIERNLTDELDIEVIAAKAALSPLSMAMTRRTVLQKHFKSFMALLRHRLVNRGLHFVLLLRYISKSRWRVELCWIIVLLKRLRLLLSE